MHDCACGPLEEAQEALASLFCSKQRVLACRRTTKTCMVAQVGFFEHAQETLSCGAQRVALRKLRKDSYNNKQTCISVYALGFALIAWLWWPSPPSHSTGQSSGCSAVMRYLPVLRSRASAADVVQQSAEEISR